MVFLTHTETPDGNIVLLAINGILDGATSPRFDDYITQLIEKGKTRFVIDAAGLEYVSSAGIGVMLYVYRKLAAVEGSIAVCSLSAEITTLYTLLGFNKILTITKDRIDAIRAIEEGTARAKPATEEPAAPPAPGATPPRAPGVGTETSPVSRHDSQERVPFENPVIVECAECRGLIRLKSSGLFQCPYCAAEFSVEKDQTVIF